MKTICPIFILFMTLFSGIGGNAQNAPYSPVPFNRVDIHDGFWSPRLEAHAHKTLEVCIAQTRDSTKRISNFEKATGLKDGHHEGIYFDDSDVYKAMEGIAYSLINNPNPEYEALLDHWIELISKAQQPDGYINTFYTLDHPEDRWTDISKHEMYCGGHMIEAAIAHHRATGERAFLDVAVKFADYLDDHFGPGKRHWVPGHQEIELALVKLYHVTQEKKYLDLAYWLLEERGREYDDGVIYEGVKRGSPYWQDDVPVSEISNIKGHAVRAMYMFSGMADVASVMDVPEYVEALERVWEDVALRNMYVTGGIGSSRSNEGFSEDFDLPNKTAYCETCASIGMVFWNNRMNLLTGEAKYVDVLERSLYNGVLPGVSLEGDLFFYVNPLESDGNHHRQRWFGCACCPSNISRFIPSVGKYVYLQNDREIVVNLFMGNDAVLKVGNTPVHLSQQTNYPWVGKVHLKVDPDSPVDFDLKMRMPGWCKSYRVSVNGKEMVPTGLVKGYLTFSRTWEKGDEITLEMDMPVELVEADPKVKENLGKCAIQRGPLVYCLEQADNPGIDMENVTIGEEVAFSLRSGAGKLKNMKILKADGENGELTFIPYFTWDNREPGEMKIWIDLAKKNRLYR